MHLVIGLLAALIAASPLAASEILYRSPAFVVTDTAVRQGPFEAVAVSPDQIVTNYPRAAREVMLKFSINGADNEFPPGQDHMFYVRPRDGKIVTPVYTFGELDPPMTPSPVGLTSEEGTADVTIRVDMRHVLESFRTTGAYDPPNGPPITADAFEGVYVAGNADPLSWDFSRLRPGSAFQLHDPDGDGIYAVTLPFEATYNRPLDEKGRAVWKRTRDISRFPQYTSSQPLVDAIYRLSLEELLQLTREDGAILGGAKWPDVWTRDTAWGAILGFAPIAPDEVRRSLTLKVDAHGRIVQDTGTGGSWPVSTDRVAWAVAAWELYAATGDREWLRTAFDVIRRSADADLKTAFDSETGLFFGESSFLDWREQSYPRWIDPKDIYASQSLGTNALHFATWQVLGRMARELGESPERFDAIAAAVREGMNTHLWQSDRGYYGQYRYGRLYPSLSPRAEGLGEAFTILFGIAGDAQRRRLAERNPVVPFGVPSFWPYIGDIPPYHNAGIWPQVVGFWTWAAAEAGNTAGVEHGLASIYRATALFLTNKENMVAATGHFEGTELNSDRLIGSVGAALATVYRVLLGIRFEPDRLVFEPHIPESYDGTRTLSGLRYRNATLTVTVHGFGEGVASVKLDGRPIPRAEIPATLDGAHTLEITMNGVITPSNINLVENVDTPDTPVASVTSDRIGWSPVAGAVSYTVYRNGEVVQTTTSTAVDVAGSTTVAEYQVAATGPRGLQSFLSEPLRAGGRERIIEIDDLMLTPEKNTSVSVVAEIDEPGEYAIDVLYGNGSGPVNSSNRAAIRSLLVNRTRAGALVMPQRGWKLWEDRGYSNTVRVRLDRGRQALTIAYTPDDRNMNVSVNDAIVDHVRLTKVD